MNMNINSDINGQLEKLFRQKNAVISAYIIGSYAKASERKESDFDLAVVVEDKKNCATEEIYGLIRSLSFPKDLDLSIVDHNSSPLFLFEIISKGIRIYSRDRSDSAMTEASFMHKYYDTSFIRNIYYTYLKDKFPQNAHK